MVRASAKMHKMIFIDLDICQRMIPLQNLHLINNLDPLFQCQKYEIFISWKQWELS